MAKILIVEDDAAISRYLGTMLVSDGNIALSADSPARAWQHLHAERDIKLVMIDHHLGPDEDANGLNLLADLRSSPAHRDIPVIVCTGETKPEIVTGFVQHKVAAFIRKPFQPQRLMADVRRVLYDAAARERAASTAAPPKLIKSVEE
jgi:DNA-binding NtrC family response regulator